jgi:phosphohistidine phosphatase
MKVFIMRHGEAGMHAPSDAERSLTDGGRANSIQAARWLKTQFSSLGLTRLDKAMVSPYLRAQQTLDAVSTILTPGDVETVAELTPSGNEERVADYLRLFSSQGTAAVLVVSHLPLVGYLVSELCPDVNPPMFATSAIVCVTVTPDSHRATVDWHYHP